MFRSLITATFATAVLVAGASVASADPGDYYADGYTSLARGTGTVSASTAADAYGRMTVDSEATGGSKRGLLGSQTRLSSAYSLAYVSDVVVGNQGGNGRYRVTITYSGAYASEVARGSGQARGTAVATVFIDDAAVGYASAELTSSARQVVLTIEFTENFAGTPEVAVQAEVNARAEAKGKGNSADTQAHADAVTFTLTKIG